jgi:hypothetical protein
MPTSIFELGDSFIAESLLVALAFAECLNIQVTMPSSALSNKKSPENHLLKFQERGVALLGAHTQQRTFPAIEDEAAQQIGATLGSQRKSRSLPSPRSK